MDNLKSITVGLVLLGSIGIAPIIPAGNGVISYAVFEDHATGEKIYQEIPDSQYAQMGQKDGNSFNPTATSSDGVVVPMRYSAQYPTKDQDAILTSYQASATSTTEIPPLNSFTDTDSVSLFQYLAPMITAPVSAAVAFDAVSTGAISGTSITFSHTIGGANADLVCFVANENNVDDVTGVTFNTVALVQKQLASPDAFTVSHQYLFNLENPATGAHNVVVSRTATGSMSANCQSYLNASYDNSGIESSKSNATSMTYTATTTSSTAWVATAYGWQRAPTASTGITQRTAGDGSLKSGDSNGIVTSPYSMTFTYASIVTFGGESATWIVLKPFVVASTVLSDPIILQDE